jgi:hypothetical protein
LDRASSSRDDYADSRGFETRHCFEAQANLTTLTAILKAIWFATIPIVGGAYLRGLLSIYAVMRVSHTMYVNRRAAYLWWFWNLVICIEIRLKYWCMMRHPRWIWGRLHFEFSSSLRIVAVDLGDGRYVWLCTYHIVLYRYLVCNWHLRRLPLVGHLWIFRSLFRLLRWL